jgi:ADP-ribose pyrophosphatase YjhB (NUDIX family)
MINEIAQKLSVPIFPSDTNEVIMKKVMEQLEKIPYIPFPVSFHTVDMAPYRYNPEGEIEILLGRKPFRTVFQFLGGFLDPKNTAEYAAKRELAEETSNTVIVSEDSLNYIKSFFIDDSRYINSCHKVTTSFFSVQIGNEINATHGDDIAEVKWFKINDLIADNSQLLPQHYQLLYALNNALIS